jgi:hypothetical protein
VLKENFTGWVSGGCLEWGQGTVPVWGLEGVITIPYDNLNSVHL